MTKIVWWDKQNEWHKTYRLTLEAAFRKAVALQSNANAVFLSMGHDFIFV